MLARHVVGPAPCTLPFVRAHAAFRSQGRVLATAAVGAAPCGHGRLETVMVPGVPRRESGGSFRLH